MSFLSSLSRADILRLRGIVRRTHMSHYPSHLQTDWEADRIIEAIGADVAEQMIMNGLETRTVEKKIIV